MQIILDCDAAYEDLMALIILLNNSDLKLVTVAYGESTPRIGAQNVERVCRALHPTKRIEIAYGQNKPIDNNGTRFPDFIEVEANTILKDSDIPELDEYLSKDNAIDLMYETLISSNEPIIIVATGPLTNIAKLLNKYPHCISYIEKLVIMGGAVYVPGNINDLIKDTTNLVAEWNIYADPVAAEIVFSNPSLQITLVPIDVTRQMPITRKFMDSIKSPTSKSLKLVHDMLNTLLGNIGEKHFYGNLQFWDSLSAMISLDESMVECDQNQTISVEVSTGQTKVNKQATKDRAIVKIARTLLEPEMAYTRFIELTSNNTQLEKSESYEIIRQPAFF